MIKQLALAVVLGAGSLLQSPAQSYYDDDIYYNADKAKKEKQDAALKAAQKKAQANYVPNQSVDYPGADTYTVSSGSTRDVDEYNRRTNNTDNQVITGDENGDFSYTRQIERFYNPGIVEDSGDETLQYLYYAAENEREQKEDLTQVNIYINSPSWGWSSYWPYYNSYAWGPSWAWNSWYGFYSPSWSWSFNYWPSWSWSVGSWGWNWGWNWGWTPGWSWGWSPVGPPPPPARPGWRPGPSWGHHGGYNPPPRPGQNLGARPTQPNGARPGTGSTLRPTQTGSQGGNIGTTRPGARPSTPTRVNSNSSNGARPGAVNNGSTMNGARPGTGNAGTGARPSVGNGGNRTRPGAVSQVQVGDIRPGSSNADSRPVMTGQISGGNNSRPSTSKVGAVTSQPIAGSNMARPTVNTTIGDRGTANIRRSSILQNTRTANGQSRQGVTSGNVVPGVSTGASQAKSSVSSSRPSSSSSGNSARYNSNSSSRSSGSSYSSGARSGGSRSTGGGGGSRSSGGGRSGGRR